MRLSSIIGAFFLGKGALWGGDPCAEGATFVFPGNHVGEQAGEASDHQRLRYLIERIGRCIDFTAWTPEENDATFGRLPQAHRDLLMMEMFYGEVMNGGISQYFYNSGGVNAPDLAATLMRVGLNDLSAAVEEGMAFFEQPYPRDTDHRRSVWETIGKRRPNLSANSTTACSGCSARTNFVRRWSGSPRRLACGLARMLPGKVEAGSPYGSAPHR
jgi:hypothetical protein